MADIQKPDPDKHGTAVESVTEVVPHEADASSSPSTLPDDVNRPPVSTNRPDVPIAHSLVAGAGAPTGEPDYRPEEGQPEPAEPEAEAKKASASKPAVKDEK